MDAKGGDGALRSSAGSQHVGALPKPASSNPETHHTTSAQSECAYRRGKELRSQKTVLGLCIRIHEFILYTNKVHSSELPAPRIYASVKIKRHNSVRLLQANKGH